MLRLSYCCMICNFKSYSSLIHAFSHLVSRTRHNLIEWKNQGLNLLETEIKFVEDQINFLESQDQGSFALDTVNDYPNCIPLRSFYNRYNAFLRQNNLKWAKWAKLKWVHNGDINSSFAMLVLALIDIKIPFFTF